MKNVQQKKVKAAAKIIAALNHPTRRKMLTLMANKEFRPIELRKLFKADQNYIAFHLKLLSDSGYLIQRFNGKASLYHADVKQVDRVTEAMEIMTDPMYPL